MLAADPTGLQGPVRVGDTVEGVGRVHDGDDVAALRVAGDLAQQRRVGVAAEGPDAPPAVHGGGEDRAEAGQGPVEVDADGHHAPARSQQPADAGLLGADRVHDDVEAAEPGERRFPTRSALVTAAFTEQLSLCASALDEALADPDPGHGLYALLEKVCTTLVTDRGFETVLMARFPEALDYDKERACAEEGLARLVRRAREAGQLREDFDPADISLLLLAVTGPAGLPRETALAASRRLLTSLFQAFRPPPPGRPAPLPPAPPMGLGEVHRPPGRP